jgi:hypothetical protein
VTDAETTKAEEKEKQEAPPPSLADDFLKLEQLNLLRTVTIRMQGGRHPSREIEGLLQRRMNFSSEELQGPYVTRLICTIMMIFVAATIVWGILWAVSNIFELSYFLRLISTGIATLIAALAGVAIFHPSSIPDEKALSEAIETRMNELRKELGENEQKPAVPEKPEDTKPAPQPENSQIEESENSANSDETDSDKESANAVSGDSTAKPDNTTAANKQTEAI